jgi:hypothetical protein
VVPVLSGRLDDGLEWVVTAGGSDADFSTMLAVYRDGRQVAGSGFAGPKLYGDSVMNEYRGRTDDLPYFVMARVHPSIDRVVATTDRGTDVVLTLSESVAQFGLRFGAAALPQDEAPASIRAETNGDTIQSLRQ